MTTHIPLQRGLVALIDDEDIDLVKGYRWYADVRPRVTYVRANAVLEDGRRRAVYLHHVVTGATGVDHVNHDGLDNRRKNLRIVGQGLNNANQRPRGGSSQHKGVSWLKRERCWLAYIRIDGVQKRLGYFNDELAAARAYNDAARTAWGEHAYLNDLDRSPDA